MSQSVYVAKEKFVAPETVPASPERSVMVSLVSVTLLIIGVMCAVGGLLLLNLAVIFTGVAFGLAWAITYQVRNRIHGRDMNAYQEKLEQRWMESDSFIQMRDFLILMGFNPETAFEMTNNLGVDLLSAGGYSEANGYYMLSSTTGAKAFSAVQIASRLSAKNNIKVTARILQEIPD